MTTTHSFDADVSQLIHLVTHSIYSTKEVFLRELLANANDAIQKAKLLAAQDPAYLGDETDLTISIAVDTDKKIITITDTGVGMTEEEVISNLGTIAKSGTKAFLEQMKQAKEDNALVGQFGIGFYSSFMVAHTVTVETKSA
ncbi:ATP-binding protein [Patescibacteria group bacterium]|nr:ATP-binding protein [Patescibacteria group bacterium]